MKHHCPDGNIRRAAFLYARLLAAARVGLIISSMLLLAVVAAQPANAVKATTCVGGNADNPGSNTEVTNINAADIGQNITEQSYMKVHIACDFPSGSINSSTTLFLKTSVTPTTVTTLSASDHFPITLSGMYTLGVSGLSNFGSFAVNGNDVCSGSSIVDKDITRQGADAYAAVIAAVNSDKLVGLTPGTYKAIEVLGFDIGTDCSQLSGSAHAYQFNIAFTVPKLCVASTTAAITLGSKTIQASQAVEFGTITASGTTSTPINVGQGGVSVLCSNGTPYSIHLDGGLHQSSTGVQYRQMANGSALLPYRLYQDSGRSVLFAVNGSSDATNLTGTGAAVVTRVYGQIPAGIQIPTARGDYNDTVTVTVTY
jgi:spore coat protein U-like protein